MLAVLLFNLSIFNINCTSRNDEKNKNDKKYNFKEGVIQVHNKKLNVEIANNQTLRSRGLMFRKELPTNEGMLFIFDYEQYLSFWMKNTYIPLSIAFIDENGVIFDIFDMKPLDETPIKSTKKGLYALEMNKGWFKRNNIIPGHRMEIIEIKK